MLLHSHLTAAKLNTLQVDPEALVSGASVMFVPEPKGDGEQNWEWCDYAPLNPERVSAVAADNKPQLKL